MNWSFLGVLDFVFILAPLVVIGIIRDQVYKKYQKIYQKMEEYAKAKTNAETALYVFFIFQALAVLHVVAYVDTWDIYFLEITSLWQALSGALFIVYLYYHRKVKEFEKLQMIQDAIAKGVEIGMKKAKES